MTAYYRLKNVIHFSSTFWVQARKSYFRPCKHLFNVQIQVYVLKNIKYVFELSKKKNTPITNLVKMKSNFICEDLIKAFNPFTLKREIEVTPIEANYRSTPLLKFCLAWQLGNITLFYGVRFYPIVEQQRNMIVEKHKKMAWLVA